MDLPTYKLLSILEDEVREDSEFNQRISSLVNLFIKYLKEPRYQSPLSVNELSKLFQTFYKDLNSLVFGLYTQSKSTKKELIAKSSHFNNYQQQFDYLLAIANYSTSSVKLSKRTDDEALQQLRIFNYYKFLYVFYAIENSQKQLFNSVNGNEDIRLYDKIYGFDQRDILLQECLDRKINELRSLNLKFNIFYETEDQKLIDFVEGLSDIDLSEINYEFINMSRNITPYSKLINVTNIQRHLVKLLSTVFKLNQINNDILLPFMIYLAVVKINVKEVYLNFVFIKNFVHLIDPDNIELIDVNLSSSYLPSEKQTKAGKCNLFDLLNLNLENDSKKQIEGQEFFLNDNNMMNYILSKYLNNGELSYYLTNLEAVISFLFNITLPVLCPGTETTNRILLHSIDHIVNEDIAQLEKGSDENKKVEGTDKNTHEKAPRSRSSSILANITSRINETRTRSRSNSSNIASLRPANITSNKESFPSFNTEVDANTNTNGEAESALSMTMMRSLIGKLSSVSVQQFRPYMDQNQAEGVDESTSAAALHRRSSSFMARLSPNHSRTRSSSIETANNTQTMAKRNTITSKLSNGVSEFMTKLNTTTNAQQDEINKSVSNSSLHSLYNCQPSLNESSGTINTRPDYTRTRTTSLQIMDKWFNNISANQQQQATNQDGEQRNVSNDLLKYKNMDFESMTINDLKSLKKCYDKLCILVSNKEDSISETATNHS